MPEKIQIPASFDLKNGDAVRDYIKAIIINFCQKEKEITDETRDVVTEVFIRAFEANADLTERNVNKGLTDVSDEARALRNELCSLLVKPESKLHGIKHFQTAQRHMNEDGNILLVQNHTSIADMLVTEALIRRSFGHRITDDWAYLSGSPMNEPSLQLIISGGFHRFPITSTKFQARANNKEEKVAMQRQNARSMKALRDHVDAGGKLVVMYPEGGRNNGSMEKIKPTAMYIPKIMARSGKKLMILPTCVDGAVKILPPDPTDKNEHNTPFQRCSRQKADMTIGTPVLWDDITRFSNDPDIAADLIGYMIADITPDYEQRGHYKNPDEFLGKFNQWFAT